MLFDTLQFHAMESSLQALWQKQKVISQNLANYETPHYKAKTLEFEDILADLRKEEKQETAGKYHFRATVSEDSLTSARPDGNNVDMEKESLELYKTYLQSAALTQKISGQFTNIRSVLSQANFK